MRADPVPDRSPLIARLGAPSPPEGPASAPPSGALLPTLHVSNAIDLPARRQRMSRECRRARRNPVPSDSLRISRLSRAGGPHESGRALPPPPPRPPGPYRTPSTRAVLAAPLSVTRDTRRERDARAAPHELHAEGWKKSVLHYSLFIHVQCCMIHTLHNMNAATTRPDLTPHHVATPCDQGHRYVGVMPHEAQHASMRMWPKLLVHVQRSAVSLGSTLTSRPPSAHRGNSCRARAADSATVAPP